MDSKTSADFVHHGGDADPAHHAPSQTLGQRLRAAREAAGMTLGDVSAQTRVPERMLVWIEAGAYEALPTQTFTAGFIRSYAREVGVNEAEAAAQYRAENTRVVAVPVPISMRPIEPQRVPSRQLALATAAVAAVLVVGGSIYFATRHREPALSAQKIVMTGPAEAMGSGAPVSPTLGDTRAGAPVSSLPAPGGPAGLSANALPSAGTGAGTGAGSVTLTAIQDAWIQVRDRATNTRVMSGVLAQGQTYAVPPGDYTLSTGRAGALQVKMDGRLLPPLGGPVDMLRDVSLGAASLAARGGSSAPAPAAQASPFAASSRSPNG